MDPVSHHKPDNPVSSIHGGTLLRSVGIALLYLMLAWVIQAGAVNPFTHLIGGGDAFIQGIAAKTFSTSFCPWNPYVQSGKFVFADVLYQSFYPPSLILLSIFPNTFGFNLFLLFHYALAGLFVYLYLGSLRLTNYSAFAGGLIFMLCGFMTAHKSHEYILSAAVWLPLTLHFIHRYAERLRILDLGYAAVPVALSVLAGFPQITLYSTVLAIAYVPFCFAGSRSMGGFKTKVAHIFCAEFVMLGIGGLLGSLPLFSVAATLPAFTRERITYGMFTSDNFPPLQLLTFLIPNLFGGVNHHIPAYAPDTTVFVAEVYGYLGILPLTLALAGLSAWRTARRELKFWSAVAVIALLMSFGGTTPIYLLLFHVPVYNLFRVPARHLFEVGLALSILAAIGLDSLLISKASAPDAATLARRAFAQISLLLGITFLAAVALRFLAEGWWYPIPNSAQVNYLYTFGAVKQAIIRNLSWNSPTLMMPLLFFVLTAGVLFLLAGRRLRVTALIAIPILILADTFFAARRMYDNPPTGLMSGNATRPELDILRANHFDRDHYRLFPVDFDIGPMARLTSTYHLSTIYPYPLLNVLSALPVINDYGPFWPKRYQAVTGFNAGGGMPIANLQNYKMLSLLGTRFLMVLSAESRRAVEKLTINMEAGRGGTKVFPLVAVTANRITIFENPSVFPRFRFVHRIRPVQDLEGALSWMNRPEFNPAEEAVAEGISTDTEMAPGKILGERLEATQLHWEVETSGRSFFVVADSFFPGWTATVDGQPVPIYAVYGCVRGIQIQTAGQHRVEMHFAPPGLAAGLACTSAGFLILCLLWLGDRTGRLNRIPLDRHLRSSHRQYKEDAV